MYIYTPPTLVQGKTVNPAASQSHNEGSILKHWYRYGRISARFLLRQILLCQIALAFRKQRRNGTANQPHPSVRTSACMQMMTIIDTDAQVTQASSIEKYIAAWASSNTRKQHANGHHHVSCTSLTGHELRCKFQEHHTVYMHKTAPMYV